MPADTVAYLCPYCETRQLETAATLPYVRGEALTTRFGNKKIVGCRRCVRRQLLLETGKSGLIGWFSPAALIANPVMLVYGLGRSLIVTSDAARVREVLREAGIPEPEEPVAPVRIAYSLAAALIAADRKILAAEIDAAARAGAGLFGDFDRTQFEAVVANHADLPEPAELASVLKTVLDENAKVLVFRYLLAIASADGEIAPEERTLLHTVASNLGITGAGKGVDRAA